MNQSLIKRVLVVHYGIRFKLSNLIVGIRSRQSRDTYEPVTVLIPAV